ncbi:DUF397 domain-containing protein [Nocardia terpenica]
MTNQWPRAAYGNWFKSSYSDHGNACVEIRFVPGFVQMRDSKYSGAEDLQPIITIPIQTWPHFLAIASGDAIDNGTVPEIPMIEHDSASGAVTVQCRTSRQALAFTNLEWTAFVAGVFDREFAFAVA